MFEPLSTLPKAGMPPSKVRRWSRLATVADTQSRAAIELKCLECSAWERPQARDCHIEGCPLWAINRRIFG
jgi:hypothetical protein